MNGILGMIQNLKTTPLAPDQQEMVDIAETSSNDLLIILNDILDLSKMEANKLSLEISSFDLRKELSSMVKLMESSAAAKDNVLRLKLHHEPEPFLKGDVLRIHQIVGNLVSNAIKFTSEGKITIHCETTPQKDDHIELRISVEDTRDWHRGSLKGSNSSKLSFKPTPPSLVVLAALG